MRAPRKAKSAKAAKTGAQSPRNRRPAGEGERAAARGYGSQYHRAAGLIYSALVNDELVWIGVADPSAGVADDIVLGLRDKVIGHQFKAALDPKTFTVSSLFLGADNLIGQLSEAWSRLRTSHPGDAIEVWFVTDDIPSTSDTLVPGKRRRTSARFLREFRSEGPSRRLTDWSSTEWSFVVARFAEKAGLASDEFESFFRSLRIVSGQEAGLLTGAAFHRDGGKIEEIGKLLPDLVRHPSDRVRWTREALLDRLGWSDAVGRRRPHQFPLGPHVQRNEITEKGLTEAIDGASSGYVSLLGPPGSGKSTLLQLALHPTIGRAVVRYLAFLPGGVQGIGRGEAEEFLRDIVQALYGTGLPRRSIHDATVSELTETLEALLKGAAERYAASGIKTVIVVDGLDHVPREERPQDSFLRVLPLPAAMPEGVVFVLGSQTLALDDLPPAVAAQAGQAGRQVAVQPLTRGAVSAMAVEADLDAAELTDLLVERGKGHPLATRYLITAAQNAFIEGRILDWDSVPEFGGEIEKVYGGVWAHLAGREAVQRVLRFVALSEKPLEPDILASLASEQTVEDTFKAAGHLLTRDSHGRWSIFHNSFRLFIETQPILRFGRPDESGRSEMLRQLAGATSLARTGDPQRWLAFRYLFRAGDLDEALARSGLSVYRTQLREGRTTSDIQDDIRLAFQALSTTHDHVRLAELLLARREIEVRGSSLQSDGIISANLSLGRIDAALDAIGDCTTLEGDVIDALVAAGRDREARELFDRLDPMDEVITGTHSLRSAEDSELALWARTAHRFRGPELVAATLNHIRATPPRESNPLHENWMVRLADDLAMTSAEAQIGDDPGLNAPALARQLGLPSGIAGKLALTQALAYLDRRDPQAAISALREVIGKRLQNGDLRIATMVALRLGDDGLASRIFASASPPTLKAAEKLYDAASVARLVEQVALHARIAARFGQTVDWEDPTEGIYRGLQSHLVKLGEATGEAEAGRAPPPSLTGRALRTAFMFLANVRKVDFHRAYTVEGAGKEIGRILACLVDAYDVDGFEQLLAEFDRATAENPWFVSWTQMQLSFLRSLRRPGSLKLAPRLETALSGSRGRGTPNEELDHLGQFAALFAELGDPSRAENLLNEIHNHSLGYSLPAKKDPQYEIWSTAFTKACQADAARAPQRIKFLAGLLNGMTETEGRDAADRIVPSVLKCAGEFCPSSALMLADTFVKSDQVIWTTLCDSILSAVVSAQPGLAEVVGHVWARLVVPYQAGEAPYWRRDKTNLVEWVISELPADRLDRTVKMLVSRIEAEADWKIRTEFLAAVQKAYAARSPVNAAKLDDVVARWAAEAPPKDYETASDTDKTFPEDLEEFEAVVSAATEPNYRHSQHLIRLLQSQPLARIQESITKSPKLLEGRDLAILAERKVRSGDLGSASWLAAQSEASGARNTTWDPWMEGTKLRLHRVQVALEGEPARNRAFEAVCMDIGHGREFTLSLLGSLEEVLELVAETPDWPSVWEKFELYLSGFREYREGPDIEPEELVAGSYRTLLVGLIQRCFKLTSVELHRHALIAASRPDDGAIARDFILEAASGHSDEPLFATVLLSRIRDVGIDPALRSIVGQLSQSEDFCVAVMASRLGLMNGVDVDTDVRPLPAFYELALAPAPRFSLRAPRETLVGGDVLSLIQSLFSRQITLLERISSVPTDTLARRAAQFAGEWIEGNSLAKLDREGAELQKDLHLGLAHTRPTVQIIFRALRRVTGELWHAGLVPRNAVDLLMFENLAASVQHVIEPTCRPKEIRRALPKGSVYGDAEKAWLQGEDVKSAPVIAIDGRVVIAEYSRFWTTKISAREAICVRLPALDQLDSNKPGEIHERLPAALGLSRPEPLYDAPSPHFVARIKGGFQAEAPDGLLTFCPIRAGRLGWELAEGEQARWLNADGELMAETIWWRDGGPESHTSYDTRAYAEGFLVTLTQPGKLGLLSQEQEISIDQREWRRLKDHDFHQASIRGGARGVIQ